MSVTTPAPKPTPILEMRGITKQFPGVLALSEVNLEVFPGEIVALIGENGAGKSTLMKILGGLYVPDAGTIRIAGEPAPVRSVGDAIRRGIAFIHQELNVLDNLDIAGNVFLGREPVRGPLRLIDRKKIHAQTETFLRRLGLDLPTDLPLSRLSIAQQQMVEIAKALSLEARLIIMDEPTSSLTQTETERLLTVAEELRAQGVSIIYISHRLGEIARIADRVVALRDGANVGNLPRDAISHENMVRLMVGRDLDRAHAPHAARPQGPGLEVRNLRTLRYPGKSVSLSVGRGEVLGLAGLVGAGRSELARAIFGVDERLGGTIYLEGKPITIRSPQDAIARGIYLVPEDRRGTGLITEMLIRENVTLPSLARYAPGGLIQRGPEQRDSAETCRALNVKAPSVEVRAGNLSGGNQQKVVLAKWLSRDPKVLIFDEPTRGIDVGAKAEIYGLMRGLAEKGVAVLMISSDMEEVLGISDRVAVMHEGGVTGTLDRDLLNEENVMRLAVGGGEKAAPPA